MKLFKKLAAVVLAAALALTMVGCGGGNSYAMQNELLKLSIDYMSDTVTHTKRQMIWQQRCWQPPIQPLRRRKTRAQRPRSC